MKWPEKVSKSKNPFNPVALVSKDTCTPIVKKI
jgi:hypothetical protein